MLEHFTNQASGLLGLIPPPAPKCIAMVSHGDEQAELPLLWRLCLALVNYGYAVTVLDATTCESETNPGLEQLLDDVHEGGINRAEVTEWAVLPAARAVHGMCAWPERKSEHLQQIGRLFPQYGVVILYSRAEWIVSLMGGCAIDPLLAVSPTRNSLLTGYQALKRLLLNGKLQPTIVNVQTEQMAHSSVTNLGECAKNFLGYETRSINITTSAGDELPHGEMQRLALRLLESAMPLNSRNLMPMAGDATMEAYKQVDNFAGSH
ncbi:MAG: hypothetical protein IPH35_00945 [Rhodoferax sp.]|nr:hypothetical protein [Rhodoferax sp.]